MTPPVSVMAPGARDRDRPDPLVFLAVSLEFDNNFTFTGKSPIQWRWDNWHLFHQNVNLFDVSRCFVFTELIAILESWCHMVMRSCPLRRGVSFTILQHHRTPSITETVNKVKAARRNRVNHEAFPNHRRDGTRLPAGTVSSSRKRVSPDITPGADLAPDEFFLRRPSPDD